MIFLLLVTDLVIAIAAFYLGYIYGRVPSK